MRAPALSARPATTTFAAGHDREARQWRWRRSRSTTNTMLEQGPGLSDRHAGAGAPADAAAPARCRGGAQYRLLYFRLSRLAARRVRPGAVERAALCRAQPHQVLSRRSTRSSAPTAVWGSQQIGLFPGAKYDGVFAIWYGKGPGVDRSGDALKHGNSAGTAPPWRGAGARRRRPHLQILDPGASIRTARLSMPRSRC